MDDTTDSSADAELPDDATFGRVTYCAPLSVFTDLAGTRHDRAVVSWPGETRVRADGTLAEEPVIDGVSQ